VTKTEIEALLEKQRKISERNYRNYQESGVNRYWTAYNKAEDIISLCEMALDSAEDHDLRYRYSTALTRIGSMVISAVHNNDVDYQPVRANQMLRDIKAIIKGLIDIRDPWEDNT